MQKSSKQKVDNGEALLDGLCSLTKSGDKYLVMNIVDPLYRGTDWDKAWKAYTTKRKVT